jgi:hypothetical protein
LEGESVQRSDFKGIDAKAIKEVHVGHDIKKAALNDRQGTFHVSGKEDLIEGQSVYKAEYQKKALPSAVRHFVGESKKGGVAQSLPLEGVSVQHSDYLAPASKSSIGSHVYDKVPNFKPPEAKYSDHEDRDFFTESKKEFQAKSCECPVLLKKETKKAKAQDGHIYFADESASAAA